MVTPRHFTVQVGSWLHFGSNWPRLVLTTVLIGVVSVLEAISIAKALAERSQETVDPDRELLGSSLENQLHMNHESWNRANSNKQHLLLSIAKTLFPSSTESGYSCNKQRT